mgnify:FL=1
MNYIDAFKKEEGLIARLGESNAYLIWTMGLYLDESELDTLATNCLTDECGDKKIDFLQTDMENRKIIFVQGTYSPKPKDGAKANKASDMNTAMAWFLNGNLAGFPEHLQKNVEEARKAIDDDKIDEIEIIYLHNNSESKPVKDEMEVVKENFLHSLKGKGIDHIHVTAKEIGSQTADRLFKNRYTNIMVDCEVKCPFPVKYEETGAGWKAAVLTVSGAWLRELYKNYGNDLFSANYRGFLGYNRKQINTKIKETAEHSPQNFWSFNNGITILTNKYTKEHGKVSLDGLSVINGAQTTGAIGSLDDKVSLADVKVLARIIESEDVTLIDSVIKYNNTQNQITAWDKFGNHPFQEAISSQFKDLGHDYSFKRGFDNRDNSLGVEKCMQQLLAFQGQYRDANRSKTALFESTKSYNDAFEHVKARHILFVYVVNQCVEDIRKQSRIDIKTNKENRVLKMYQLFTEIKSKHFVLAVIGETISSLFGDLGIKKEICFTPEFSKKSDYDINALKARMMSFIKLLVTNISNYDSSHSVLSHYGEDGILNNISEFVSNNINNLLSISPEYESVITNVKGMICNG